MKKTGTTLEANEALLTYHLETERLRNCYWRVLEELLSVKDNNSDGPISKNFNKQPGEDKSKKTIPDRQYESPDNVNPIKNAPYGFSLVTLKTF